jgi:hypothetical protein
MGKSVANVVLDAALQYLEDNADRLCICSAEPTTYAEATTTYDGGASKYKLGIATIDSDDFTGPVDGTSGRKTTVNQQTGITVDATASATHIALCDSSNSALLYVTTCTSQALTVGNTADTSAWDIEIADPS